MTSLSLPRTALAVAIVAATIAAVAGCQQQASTPSSPAALSTPHGPKLHSPKPHSTRIPKSPRTSITPTSTPTTPAPLVSSPSSDATTPAGVDLAELGSNDVGPVGWYLHDQRGGRVLWPLQLSTDSGL